MNPNPTRGKIFCRTMKSLGMGRGDINAAMAYAQGQNVGDWRGVIESIQLAAVAPVGTGDYAPPTPAAFDFAEFIRPMTILGKLIGLRRVPARVRSIAATSGSGAFWSGEKNPRPISRMTFEGETLEPLSVSAILVVTAELLRSSVPNAESILSRDLAAAAVAAMDSAFIDQSNTGIANVKPASITNGVGSYVSTGGTVAQIDADLDLMVNALSDAGSDLLFASFILSPRTALYLARLRGSGGALAHPGMTVKGGTLFGLPAITSAAVPSAGSPLITTITLLDASQILVCDDGGGALETSEKGALQMEDAPGSGAQSLVSLWQTGAAALKMTRHVSWRRCRAGMARTLVGVGY